MKCVVPSQNIKILAKAFHSLGKIGDDLFIEPHQQHLAFRTVNQAESAYASIIFSNSFFSSFTSSEDDEEESLRCRITMKSLLVVLKVGERLLEWCQIRIDPNSTKVIFQLRYSYGSTKTFFLPIIESETLQVNYSKDDCQNRLVASPKLLSTTIKNFRLSEDEVTLSITPQKIVLRNHLEDKVDSKKALRTEICLAPLEFEGCSVGAPTSITFCLKELRSALFFAEFTGLPITIYLSTAGKPVVFVVNNDTVYEANYIVSTLNECGTSQAVSQTSESSVASSARANHPPPPKKRTHSEMQQEKTNGTLPCTSRLEHNTSLQNLVPLPEKSCTNAKTMNALLLDNSGPPCDTSQTLNMTRESNVTQPIVKSVFGRCFNTTFKKQTLPGYDQVLAYDSDGMVDSD